MTTDKYAPQKKYYASAIRRFNLALNHNTDADIIAHLESMDNVLGYLKQLIRQDMQKTGQS